MISRAIAGYSLAKYCRRGTQNSFTLSQIKSRTGKLPRTRCGCCHRLVKFIDERVVFPCRCRRDIEAGLACGLCGRCPDCCCSRGYLPAAARALQDDLQGPPSLDLAKRRLGRQLWPKAARKRKH